MNNTPHTTFTQTRRGFLKSCALTFAAAGIGRLPVLAHLFHRTKGCDGFSI